MNILTVSAADCAADAKGGADYRNSSDSRGIIIIAAHHRLL